MDGIAPNTGDPVVTSAPLTVTTRPGNVSCPGPDLARPLDREPEKEMLRVVRWGGPEDSDRKAAALGALLEELAGDDLEPAATIDVSTPEAVVLR